MKSKIYIDNIFSQNPELLSKANRFYKYFMPFFGMFMCIIGIIKIQTDGNLFLAVLQILLGSILLLVILFQTTFYKKFGRLYIIFCPDNLELKSFYFKPLHQLTLGDISHITTRASLFKIIKKSAPNEAIAFRVPYSKNENIRQSFRTFAQLRGFEFEEK